MLICFVAFLFVQEEISKIREEATTRVKLLEEELTKVRLVEYEGLFVLKRT